MSVIRHPTLAVSEHIAVRRKTHATDTCEKVRSEARYHDSHGEGEKGTCSIPRSHVSRIPTNAVPYGYLVRLDEVSVICYFACDRRERVRSMGSGDDPHEHWKSCEALSGIRKGQSYTSRRGGVRITIYIFLAVSENVILTARVKSKGWSRSVF